MFCHVMIYSVCSLLCMSIFFEHSSRKLHAVIACFIIYLCVLTSVFNFCSVACIFPFGCFHFDLRFIIVQ